jgi:hypothetical protein
MPSLSYRPRSAQASPKLVYGTPRGTIELNSNESSVSVTPDQLEWLKCKYEDLRIAIESGEIIVLDNDPVSDAGANKKPPKSSKAALPTEENTPPLPKEK